MHPRRGWLSEIPSQHQLTLLPCQGCRGSEDGARAGEEPVVVVLVWFWLIHGVGGHRWLPEHDLSPQGLMQSL